MKHKVIIHCLVYNHEPYLRDCLEGFVMQKTNFPFRAVVHDDCSTDASSTIIREYAEKYPDIIEPIYETENQWRKGTLTAIMDTATMGRSDYIAYCEGDDYWIDPYKLQKQVDYMDAHPECTMVCSDARIEAPKGILTEEDLKTMGWYHYNESRIMAVEDVITKGGWFIHTCTIMHKANLKEHYPIECSRCCVADYPLQIFASLNGSIYYMHEKMAVYRYMSVGSWSSKRMRQKDEREIRVMKRNVEMLEALNQYSHLKYDNCFRQVIVRDVTCMLLENPHLIFKTCEQLGYIFVNRYLETQKNNQHKSLVQKMKNAIVRIKWHPFDISNFINCLRQMSFSERRQLGKICKSIPLPNTYK